MHDILVVASDGMLDNLYDKDVKKCIKPQMKGTYLQDPQQVAECLAKKAEVLGLNEEYYSPFAKHAADWGLEFTGGKADDVTVIVAQIQHK